MQHLAVEERRKIVGAAIQNCVHAAAAVRWRLELLLAVVVEAVATELARLVSHLLCSR